MSRKYKIQDQDKPYFVTFTVIQWLDIFIRKEYKDILLESLCYCQQNKGLEVYAYCIMTSHAHLIIARNDDRTSDGTIGDIKKFTAKRLIEAIKTNPQESRKELLMW